HLKCDDPEAQKRLWLNHIDRTPHKGFKILSRVKGFESSECEQFDLHLTDNIIRIASPEIQKRSYLDSVHFHRCPHTELLPVNRIKRDMKLSAYRCDLLGCRSEERRVGKDGS